MARLMTSFMSESLQRAIHLDIVVPTDHMVMPKAEGVPALNKPYKTLYYLEGALGNDSGPFNYSRLMCMAEDYNLVVVCIGGENKWWSDSPNTGDRFGDMVVYDVVNFTRRLFNLSHKREDTFIGGFSMGGHGAFVLGLRNPELFGAIVSVDASLQKWAITNSVEAGDPARWDISTATNYKNMFGIDDVNDWVGSEYDYEYLAKQVAEKKKEFMPNVFIACGNEDSLFGFNEAYRDQLKDLGYEVEWLEIDGNHSYYTCDIGMEAAMKFLPLEDNFCTNYPYYGRYAYVDGRNFIGWKTICNVEAEAR